MDYYYNYFYFGASNCVQAGAKSMFHFYRLGCFVWRVGPSTSLKEEPSLIQAGWVCFSASNILSEADAPVAKDCAACAAHRVLFLWQAYDEPYKRHYPPIVTPYKTTLPQWIRWDLVNMGRFATYTTETKNIIPVKHIVGNRFARNPPTHERFSRYTSLGVKMHPAWQFENIQESKMHSS